MHVRCFSLNNPIAVSLPSNFPRRPWSKKDERERERGNGVLFTAATLKNLAPHNECKLSRWGHTWQFFRSRQESTYYRLPRFQGIVYSLGLSVYGRRYLFFYRRFKQSLRKDRFKVDETSIMKLTFKDKATFRSSANNYLIILSNKNN